MSDQPIRMPKRAPADGPTFEDVCKLAAERGVIITIAVPKEDVGHWPPRITVQIGSFDKSVEHRAFKMDLRQANAGLNKQLGVALWERVDKVKPRKAKIIQL